jgi:hypothetical protein
MQFQNVIGVARDTPTGVLCEAWKLDATAVHACLQGERPMTIREAGALAELRGMELQDLLTI